jgi:hypothetical protein
VPLGRWKFEWNMWSGRHLTEVARRYWRRGNAGTTWYW